MQRLRPNSVFVSDRVGDAEDMRYTPATITELRNLLYGCPNLMKVEVKDEIPLNAKSVADLRKLMHWSSDWTLAIPLGRDPRGQSGASYRYQQRGSSSSSLVATTAGKTPP